MKPEHGLLQDVMFSLIGSVQSQALQTSSLRAVALEGSRQSVERLNEAAVRISKGELLISDMVTLIEEPTLYALNMKVLKTADEMAGQVLNLRA